MPNKGNLTDREAAIDALHRFLWSLDDGSADLCASSLTLNATLTFNFAHMSKPTEISGRQKCVDLLMSAVGTTLDTTHMATNVRCEVDGDDEAELQAQVLAQHFRKGEGNELAKNEGYLNGNVYKCRIVRDGEEWRIREADVKGVWTQGNPEVMKV